MQNVANLRAGYISAEASAWLPGLESLQALLFASLVLSDSQDENT